VGLWFGGALVLLAAVLSHRRADAEVLARSIGGADELAGYALAVGTTWALARPCSIRHIRIDSLYVLFPQKPGWRSTRGWPAGRLLCA